jgi:hypothetical protein
MPRPRTPVGQLGTIHYTTLADGRVRARSRIRDDSGTSHPLKTVAATAPAALELLQQRAAALSTGFDQLLSVDSTIADACQVWLEEVRTSGRVEVSTLEGYQDSVRTIVVPACGGIMLRDLTVGRADRILQRWSAAPPCARTSWPSTRSGTCNACPPAPSGNRLCPPPRSRPSAP